MNVYIFNTAILLVTCYFDWFNLSIVVIWKMPKRFPLFVDGWSVNFKPARFDPYPFWSKLVLTRTRPDLLPCPPYLSVLPGLVISMEYELGTRSSKI